jgi:hypothetical protein
MNHTPCVDAALAGASGVCVVHTRLGDGVHTALVFIAGSGTLVVGSTITVAWLAQLYSMPPAPAAVTSCSISRLAKHSKEDKYHTVVLVMSHINRGPKTWAAIKNLVRNKRVLVMEGA